MCTSIVEITDVAGAGRNGEEWFELTRAVVSYDHPHHALLEEAIIIDFVNPGLGLGAAARVAVEITLESARNLAGALSKAIAATDAELGALPNRRRPDPVTLD